MKIFFKVFWIVLAFSVLGVSFASPRPKEFQALIVSATDSFKKNESQLNYAKKDAERVAKAMRTAGRVPFGSILHLENPSTVEFNRAVEKMSRTGTKKFMFYYTGHSDDQGIHLKDGKIDRSKFHDILKKIPSKVKVVILDSCFSGALKSKGYKKSEAIDLVKIDRDEPTGSVILTSSSGNEFSYESENLKGSIFTYHLVSGLYGQADGNKDGQVTIDELYQYVYAQTKYQSMVSGGATQSPEFLSKLSGQGSLVVSYPNLVNGQIRLPKSMQGNLLLAASNGVTFFQFYKNKGEEKVIGIPRGQYQIRLEKERLIGTGDLELLEKETINLSEQHLSWKEKPKVKVEKKGWGQQSEFLFGFKFGRHPGYQDAYESGNVTDLFLLTPAGDLWGAQWRAVMSLGGQTLGVLNSQKEESFNRMLIGGEVSFAGDWMMSNRWLIELVGGQVTSNESSSVSKNHSVTRLSFGMRVVPETMPLKMGLHVGFETIRIGSVEAKSSALLGLSFSY
ncbi:MAG: caspase family protein [Bdellovibrionales bacterium]|nr:caspase family protein [Bdellovibrionales bacterium]